MMDETRLKDLYRAFIRFYGTTYKSREKIEDDFSQVILSVYQNQRITATRQTLENANIFIGDIVNSKIWVLFKWRMSDILRAEKRDQEKHAIPVATDPLTDDIGNTGPAISGEESDPDADKIYDLLREQLDEFDQKLLYGIYRKELTYRLLKCDLGGVSEATISRRKDNLIEKLKNISAQFVGDEDGKRKRQAALSLRGGLHRYLDEIEKSQGECTK
ncbi:MAG: hypothetical protein KIT79_10060 [Deltaproteobacteria bacterium]|nr:hypothetical protein [Deltaproteobacteria bacterium]